MVFEYLILISRVLLIYFSIFPFPSKKETEKLTYIPNSEDSVWLYFQLSTRSWEMC